MGGQPIRLGPFTGGLNTISDPTTIADVELAECTNYEQDLDGSLKSRAPFKEIIGHSTFTERIVFLCSAIFGTSHYAIGSNSNGVFYLLNGSFTLITNTFEAGAAVQYADKVYLVPKPGSGNGGKWDPSGGFVAVAAIPKGQACVVHKDRLYICPGVDSTTDTSRLKFSDSGNLDSWPVNNFIDIRQGNGTKLIDITIFQDNILLFKELSVDMLSYDSRPEDATLRPISDTIGVNRQFNVVNYENQIYIFSGGWVYEITNLDFLRVNSKVPFIRDDTVPSAFSDEFIFLSLLEDRLICRYYRKVYVYGLRTRTWSEWNSVKDKLHYLGPIVTIRPPTGHEYYSGSCIQEFTSAVQIYDKVTSDTLEITLDPDISVTDTFSSVVVDGWGTTDTGEAWTTSGGSASDYSKNGTVGIQSLGSVAITRQCELGVVELNPDVQLEFSSPVVATGGSITLSISARVIDSSNRYRAVLVFNTAGNLVYSISKIVAGSSTDLVASTTFGAYSVNEKFKCRFQINGNILRIRLWRSLSATPVVWTATTSDTALSTAGSILVISILNSGNTNTLPVDISWGNLQLGSMEDAEHMIECSVRTKNFDMAESHRFKRLWWWGVDCITNNEIEAIATPITSSFVVTVDDMENFSIDSFFTMDQPLTAPSFAETLRSTGMGVVRQFIKLNKAMRYRQINFYVKLLTQGNTIDGPAKIFTMTAMTRPSQIVSKAVS